MKRNLPSVIFVQNAPWFLCILFFLSVVCPAQTVTTLPVKELDGPNGFAIDSGGNLYVANETGKKVIRIVNDSIAENILSSDSPDGLDFDNDGNLFVTHCSSV